MQRFQNDGDVEDNDDDDEDNDSCGGESDDGQKC